MINAVINGIHVEVPKGSTILDACNSAKVYVPTLCNHPDLPASGKCGICVVKVNGTNYVLACATKISEGMMIETSSPDVKSKAFQALTQFNDMPILPFSEEIEELFSYFSNKRPHRGRPAEKTNSIEYDPKLCINCGRCSRACSELQEIGALDEDTHPLTENECIGCGQCISVCPTKALAERSSIPEVIKAMTKGKTLILQTSPSTRVTLGECFGDPTGTIVTGKMISAAREIGFKYVFDTSFGADMTVIEEGTELLSRINSNGTLPMFSSCCPAWVNFVEKIHPELIPNLCTSKSPHIILGSIIKTYFAEKKSLDPKSIFVVSLMPCTAKKDEIKRKQLNGEVDAVLTCREFGDIIKQFEIDWASLPNGTFDQILGESSGSASLFAVSGGLTEAIVRYIYENLTKSKLGATEFPQWRGSKSLKTAEVTISSVNLKIAVCNGCATAKNLIESGKFSEFNFVEVMACPNGCITGGGQPKLKNRTESSKRSNSIYLIDSEEKRITANDNNEVTAVYSSFLGVPFDGKALELLHTHFNQMSTPLIEMKKKIGGIPIIAFGSQTGHAELYARQLSRLIGVTAVDLADCDLQRMRKSGSALIICSTFGDGEFPDSVIPFAKQVSTAQDNLYDLHYSVCAIGSREYPKFCCAGKAIDKWLTMRGARRIAPCLELDYSKFDHGEAEFEEWAHNVLYKLGLSLSEEPIKILRNANQSDEIHESPMKPSGFDIGMFSSNSLLTPNGFEPQMRKCQIRLPHGMTYQTGDLALILPQNDPDTVKAVISELKLDPNQIITFSEEYGVIPRKVTVIQLFSQFLDLSGLPSRKLLRAFKSSSTDQFSQERLGKLLEPCSSLYEETMRDMSVAEFVLEYSRHGIPPLEMLIPSFPLIAPRHYSIASSPTTSSNDIDLIISDHVFGPGNSRRGLCTAYIQRFGVTKVPIRIQRGYFSYPKDQTAPIIMVAFDERIASFLSLIQYRDGMNGERGSVCLFYGCRKKQAYPSLESILHDYVEQGLVQNLFFAYPRDGTNKIFISDLMMANSEIVWNYWSNPRSVLFYSGPSRGIPDQVKETLTRITTDRGQMNRVQAEHFCAKHFSRIMAF